VTLKSKHLFVVTAAIETATGVALVGVPAVAVRLLIGTGLDAPGLVVTRIAGSALLCLGVVCWVTSNDTQGRTVRGLIAALLLYNVAVLVLLAHANLGLHLTGIGLWPAVSLHAAFAAWCIACSYPAPAATTL